MNIPYSWLKELVPDAPSVEVLEDLLPQIGLGVEAVHELSAPPAGVVIGLVETVAAIEGSDHLKACMVSDGSATYSVVCGAPNVCEGMLSALAKPGVYLAGAGFTVEKRKMMGVASDGVLCSPKELELYDYGGGLIEFGDDAELGKELADYWPREAVLELEITPNRADAFSVLGVARDLAAKLGVSYVHPAQDAELGDSNLDDGMTLSVEDTHIEGRDGCPRFTLRRINGVNVKPSPIWMQRRLAAIGLRPRNNIVDVTNYVTFELGHPSHAYDKDNIANDTIVVRLAAAGEKVVTLTEQEIGLTEQDIIITMPNDAGGTTAIGIAGVIGGLHDSIYPTTTNVALEAAHWDPVSIRKTAKRHGIFTDAHYRYERGVDPNLSRQASARAAYLMAELSGGTVHAGVTDVGVDKPLVKVPFRPSRVEFLMALEVPLVQQKTYLEALGCSVEERGDDDWLITAPSWRFDMAIEEDIIEEVARLYGYEHVGESVPDMHFIPEGADTTHRELRDRLMGLGLTETMTYIFTSDVELAKANAPEAVVRVANPQGVERSVLRTVLYPGLIEAAVTNHNQAGLALFEIGHVFNKEETERLSLLMQGDWVASNWQAAQATDFYVFKGVLEKLASELAITMTLEPEHVAFLHPGVSAAVYWQGQKIGFMGRLHPEIEARFGLNNVFLAELDMPLEAAALSFKDYARQPHAERDIAVIVPKNVSYAELESIAKESAGDKLESLRPFDVYEGKPIPEGHKSVALRLWFRHNERALKDNEVDAYMENVISSLKQAGYAIRDS